MIDERKLMEWLETHKILSKVYVPGRHGETYYGISFVDLRREIRRLRGGEEDGQPEEEKRLQAIYIQRTDNDDP